MYYALNPVYDVDSRLIIVTVRTDLFIFSVLKMTIP
jgi:hypothetical protein